MGLPEIVELARNFSVMVRVQGPDPKGLKMRKHAFHHYISGKTTLSSSGIILPGREPVSSVITVASIIEPFLASKHRDNHNVSTQIDQRNDTTKSDSETHHWLPAQLIALVDIPATSAALQSLTGGSLDNGWEVGWTLASGHQPYFDSTQKEASRSALKSQLDPGVNEKLATRIAILKVSSRSFEDLPNLNTSPSNKIKRGDLLLEMGAPFDIRCLPGMEGSPVFGERLEIVGMLTRPLRQRGSGAEVQLVIPWDAIITACTGPTTTNSLKHDDDDDDDDSGSRLIHPNPAELAMSSICLITINDGVWASGVLLNERGLILTNAHLLEPWRFTKTSSASDKKTMSNIFFASSTTFQSKGNIRVRVDWIWCDASVVYVSKGPLDIAVLKLESVPDKLKPIVMDFTCPAPGSRVYVTGHGLFGPRCDFLPSACVGVVAKVVKCSGVGVGDAPAMIETTAAVHPGGSGGAVLNSNGHMISLVTSNARHGGGTVIPYLNFSIPCAALEPVFNFSKDMKDISILEDLDRPNEHLSAVWALMPLVSPNPKSHLKHPKGSRFAKFVADKQLLKQTSPPSKILPSKL